MDASIIAKDAAEVLSRLRDSSLVIQHPERRRIADEIERLRAEIADLHRVDLEANRLWRALNCHDIDDFDKRAEAIMRQSLDGMHIGPTNRNGVKAMLAEHFEQIDKDACKQLRAALQTIADKGQSGEWTLPSSFYNFAISSLKNGMEA